MASADSTDLNQQHSVGEILAAALALYQRYPVLFGMLALGVIAPYDLIVTAITGSGPLATHAHESVGTTLLLDLLNFALIGPLVSALHMHAVVLITEDQKPQLGAVAVRGLQVLPVVAAAEIVAGFGIGLGFLALVIPGILLALRWSVVAQTAAVEREGWLPSLRRSGQLTQGNYGHIFGLLLVTGVLGLVMGIVSTALHGGESSAGSIAVGIAVHTIVASFSALTMAILYLDLRVRHGDSRVGREPDELRAQST
jgi:hypothetical protein